jgi:ribosome-binding factor A
MEPTRRARLGALIQEELSRVVPREVKDPRIPPVTFTGVEISPDGGCARICVTILGEGTVHVDDAGAEAEAKAEAARMKACLQGLASAAGFLRRHLAKMLNVRQVPFLQFEEDKGLKNTMRVHELLKRISEESPDGSSGDGSSG